MATPELQQPFTPSEVTLAYLEKERESWLSWKAKADRAAGMDSDLNKKKDEAMMRLDYLLDELGSLILPEVIEVNET